MKCLRMTVLDSDSRSTFWIPFVAIASLSFYFNFFKLKRLYHGSQYFYNFGWLCLLYLNNNNALLSQFVLVATLFRVFQGRDHSVVAYTPFFWGCPATVQLTQGCALFLRGPMENHTPNLWLYSQRPKALTYQASFKTVHFINVTIRVWEMWMNRFGAWCPFAHNHTFTSCPVPYPHVWQGHIVPGALYPLLEPF